MMHIIRTASRNIQGGRRSIFTPSSSTALTSTKANTNKNEECGCTRTSNFSSFAQRREQDDISMSINMTSNIANSNSNNVYTNSLIKLQQQLKQQQKQLKQRRRTFKTRSFQTTSTETRNTNNKPGSRAFAECETSAIQDLFFQFAQVSDLGGVHEEKPYLCLRGVRDLLHSIGENPDARTLRRLFDEVDKNDDGKLHLEEFLVGADRVLGGAPASLVIVVGGPGSGKGILCDRLAEECGVEHLSSGDLLRDEVQKGTPLGKEVAEIMARGELVSSAVITALIRRRTRKFPGRRVLLDGFPRSVENAHDFLQLMGKPALALHLDCDDTILMERIIKRQKQGEESGNQRADDNFETAIQRLRTYHKYHHSTMDWLREQHVPIVNLDCSGTPENVWNQLLAIGRLMRPATQVSNISETPALFDDSDSNAKDISETPAMFDDEDGDDTDTCPCDMTNCTVSAK